MAKRKRLGPVDPALLSRAPETKSMPPIAQVAGEASAGAALQSLADQVQEARATGRLVIEVPLDQIRADHYTRDRAALDGEGFEALKASLRASGQRMAIDLVETPDGPCPYGLLSGWRRLAALRALHEETSEPRFGVVRALIRRPADGPEAYLAMVEENEIRLDLSHYERARIALLAAREGVFDSFEAAVDLLFANGSRAKRSKIRSFGALVPALDGHMAHPQMIGERLGLRLAGALESGAVSAAGLAGALKGAEGSVAELAALEGALSAALPPKAPAPAPTALRPGVALSTRLRRHEAVFTLKGKAVTPELARQIEVLIAQVARK